MCVRIHCQEAAALGLFGVACVAFSVYVLGPVSFPLGVSDLSVRHAAGEGFFARFEPGFRWCLAVLSPSPGGCRLGCVWARFRCVFCPGAGACFFSFRGFRLVTSPPCGGGFFAGFASGFRWCLAVLSPWPGGCCFGRVWTRLRCVFCPGAGACFFSFRGFRLVTSPPCGGFLLGLRPDLGGVWLF